MLETLVYAFSVSSSILLVVVSPIKSVIPTGDKKIVRLAIILEIIETLNSFLPKMLNNQIFSLLSFSILIFLLPTTSNFFLVGLKSNKKMLKSNGPIVILKKNGVPPMG